MGIVLTSAGVVGLVSSAILVATAEQPQTCDLRTGAGCPPGCDPRFGCGEFLRAEVSPQRISGFGLLGASLMTTMIGAPLWGIGSLDEDPDLGPRNSDGTLMAGVLMTTIGVAQMAGGALAGIANTQARDVGTSLPFALLGTTTVLIGLPIWAAGTRRNTPPADSGPRLLRRSRGMMVGGITLTILSAATVGAGAIVASFGGDEEGLRIFSGSLAFGGLGLAMAGIPMWYLGQEKIPAGSEAPWILPPPVASRPSRPTYRPELQVGPGSVTMRVVF